MGQNPHSQLTALEIAQQRLEAMRRERVSNDLAADKGVGGSGGWLDALRQIEIAPLTGDREKTETEGEACHKKGDTFGAFTESTKEQNIKIMPSLMNGISRAGMDAAGRVWLLMRELDKQGRGWLTVDDVREKLTDKKSEFRVCGQRRLRDVLRDGEGKLWERDGRGRVWIYAQLERVSTSILSD